MKRFWMVVVMVVLFVGFALAADPVNIDINIDNGNTVQATGGNATAQQQQDQKQSQEQTTNFSTKRPHIVAQPGPSGNFMTPLALVETEKWQDYYGSVYTIETLQNIKDSGSFFDRPGLWSWFTSPVKRNLYVKKYNGEINEASQVKLVDKERCKVTRTLGIYVGTGSYGWPMESIMAYTILQAKRETNAMYYVVRYKVRNNPTMSGLAFGSGAAGSIIQGGSNDSKAGSMSVGAIIGTSTAYLEYAFDVEVLAVEAERLVVKEEVSIPVVAPAPEPQACNPSEYLVKIRESEKRIANCFRYSHGNMVDRRNAARENLNAYICTKDVHYLREAIEHYKMAELNYIHGWDIRKYSDSDAIIAEVEYGLASAFYARDGHIENFWKAPQVVVHENKKTGKDKAVATTPYEKREVLKIRHTLEKYSRELTLN